MLVHQSTKDELNQFKNSTVIGINVCTHSPLNHSFLDSLLKYLAIHIHIRVNKSFLEFLQTYRALETQQN